MYIVSIQLQKGDSAQHIVRRDLECHLMSATVAVTPLLASISAAASALLTMVPYATSATSLPPLLTTPLPICGPGTLSEERPFREPHLSTTQFLSKQGACARGPGMQCKFPNTKALGTYNQRP